MRILLSIKPKYVEQIERRSKRFEFRKQNFKSKPKEIWVYASSPVKKIVGIIYVEDVLEGSPIELWLNRNSKQYFRLLYKEELQNKQFSITEVYLYFEY